MPNGTELAKLDERYLSVFILFLYIN